MTFETNLHAIILVTSDTSYFNIPDLENLIAHITDYNKANNISELLVWANGNMLHLLEGNKESLAAKYEKITQFPTIEGTIKLFDKPINQRYFEDYYFAYKPINSEMFKPYDSFAQPPQKEFFEECLATDDSIMKIIREFIKNNS